MLIRPMRENDLDRVVIIENTCFTDPWSRENFQDSLKEPTAHLLVMAAGAGSEDIVGYCCLYHTLDEGEIVNVAVAPEYRQKGYGAALVRELMGLGCGFGVERFFLEVRMGNRAGKRLYKSLGFGSYGVRKGFYSNPREDAVLMVWPAEEVCQ